MRYECYLTGYECATLRAMSATLQVSDVGVIDIAACCPRLRSICLQWCSKVMLLQDVERMPQCVSPHARTCAAWCPTRTICTSCM